MTENQQKFKEATAIATRLRESIEEFQEDMKTVTARINELKGMLEVCEDLPLFYRHVYEAEIRKLTEVCDVIDIRRIGTEQLLNRALSYIETLRTQEHVSVKEMPEVLQKYHKALTTLCRLHGKKTDWADATVTELYKRICYDLGEPEYINWHQLNTECYRICGFVHAPNAHLAVMSEHIDFSKDEPEIVIHIS